MKNSFKLVFAISMLALAGCSPDANPPAPTVPFVDNSIVVPTFTSSNHSLSSAKFVSTVLYNSSLRVFYMRYTGAYHIESADLTNLAAPETLVTDVNEIGSLDCKLDQNNNTVKVGYATIPSFSIEDYVKFGTYDNGSYSGQNVSKGPVQTLVRIGQKNATTWKVIYCSIYYSGYQKVYSKDLNFSSSTTFIPSPVYDGTGNGTILIDYNSGPLTAQSFQTAVSSSTTAVMGSLDYNRYRFNSPTIPDIVNSDWSSTNPGYDIAPLGNYFLAVYESQTDSSMDYVSGPVVDYTEHVRLKIIDYNDASLATGSYDEGYVKGENSIFLPVTVSSGDDVSKIACISKNDNSEVGIAYLRNGHLYFTIAKYTNSNVRIGTISDLGAATYDNYTEFRGYYYSNKYYITTYNNVGGLTVWTAN